MTAEKYLEQVYRLEKRVRRMKIEAAAVKEDAYSLPSPSLEEKVQHSFNTDAPFERNINKCVDLEQQIAEQDNLLERLKQQVRDAIDALDDEDEQTVLSLQYLSYFWQKEIAVEMDIDRTTVYRKTKKALENFKVPADAIII